jgi:diguanylate cyclase (GGDEF)-like protein
MSEAGLVLAARARRTSRHNRAELVGAVLPALLFLGGAAALAALAPTKRQLGLADVLLVVAFAICSRVEVEVGPGSAVPTQIAFLPMLFTLPLRDVPLAVCAGYVLGAAFDAAVGRLDPRRILNVIGCGWFSLPPALILLAAGERPVSWRDCSLYGACFAAQCGGDFVHAAVHERIAHGLAPRALAAALVRVYAFDAVLSPVTLVAAHAGRYAFLAALPLLAVLRGFARERSRRFDAQLDADRFEELARRDALTGLANRLSFDERLGVELARAARYDRPLSLCLLDLDWFKDYNDRYGHPAGDALLRRATEAWSASLRPDALLARIGGEEFALLLPDAALDDAARIAERLREATPSEITSSAGVACWNGSEDEIGLLTRADMALYASKKGGRARLTVGF